jgi:uncharacterized membrane protein
MELISVKHLQEVMLYLSRVSPSGSYSLSTNNKLRGLSPQANYTDRATTAVGEVVPIFAGRGCYVVSATDSHGR